MGNLLNDKIFYLVIYPTLSSGVLLVVLFFFAYAYAINRTKLYRALLFFGINVSVFIFCEMFITLIGGYMRDYSVSVQFHRLEQVAVAFLIFTLPLFIEQYLDLTPQSRRGLHIAVRINFFVALAFLLIAYVFPEWFISVQRQNIRIDMDMGAMGRGREGPLYIARDIYLGVSMVYCGVLFVIDLLQHRKFGKTLPLFLGFLTALFFALDDIVYVHTNAHIGLFPQLEYSRTPVGLTILTMTLMVLITRDLLGTSKEVEKAYAALSKTEERFSYIGDNIQEVFWLLDAETGKTLYVNLTFEAMWDMSRSELYRDDAKWKTRVHIDDIQDLAETMATVYVSGQTQETRYRLVGKHGERWIRDRITPIRNDAGDTHRIIRVLEDITDRHKAQQELSYLYSSDQLTGLLNRKSFYTKLAELLRFEEEGPDHSSIVVLYINLDLFKEINDFYGYSMGDKILQEIALRLQKAIGESGLVFRFNGDEFVALLRHLETEIDIGAIAQTLAKEIEREIRIEGEMIRLTASVGIALYPKDGVTPETLIKNAEVALASAKRERGGYHFYDAAMNQRAMHSARVISLLRKATENREFALYYQPLMAPDKRLLGAEALIRWISPELGFVPPDSFISLAEQTGLIQKIGGWALAEACRQAREWQNEGIEDFFISVNLSVHQFKQENFVQMVEDVIIAYDLAPSSIHLEITESALLDDPESAIQKIEVLADYGIAFSIDDFGTGYSSLGYLKKFPVHTLKIDKSFVKDIPGSPSDLAIINAIIVLARNLNLTVIAEGVETLEQAEYLDSLSCDMLQGYLFSKPIPPNDFRKFFDLPPNNTAR